ncbi:MAG: hypothetical protein U0R65_02100 [Candidatus Nanopelagicales bacterium]
MARSASAAASAQGEPLHVRQERFTVLRREQAQADLVVTNHAMLAIDAIEGIPVLPEHDAVVIDEGHELVDRATAAITAELSASMVERAASRCRRLVVEQTLDRLLAAGDELVEALALATAQATGPMRVLELDPALRQAVTVVRDACHGDHRAVRRQGRGAASAAARQQAKAALEETHDVAAALLGFGPMDVVWLDPGPGRAVSVHRPAVRRGAPAHGAVRSWSGRRDECDADGRRWLRQHAAVLRLGDDDVTLDVGSPFDHQKQGSSTSRATCPHRVATASRWRPSTSWPELIEAAGGRTLALFSSWRGVERAEEYLRVRLRPELPILVQRRGDAVGTLVARFAAEAGDDAAGHRLAVAGRRCARALVHLRRDRPDPLPVPRRPAARGASGGCRRGRRVGVPGRWLRRGPASARAGCRPADPRVGRTVASSQCWTAGRHGGRPHVRDSLPPFWYTTDRATGARALSRLRDEVSSPD